MNHETEKLRIHFSYCITMLVMVIIAIATDRWTSQQNFTEYLTNAATLTSLVLGLVAIFYSFIANNGLAKSLGNINTVSDSVAQTKHQISEYLSLAAAATDATKASTTQMRELSSTVARDLAILGETLGQIKEQSGALQGTISTLPDRLDKLESSVLDATRTVGEKLKLQIPPVAPAVSPIADSAVERFLELAPMTGNLLAVACALAHKTQKPLVMADFSTAVDDKIENYLTGFLAAMNASQLISREVDPQEPRKYTIKSVHQTLRSRARPYFMEFLDRAYKNDPGNKEPWVSKLAKVEALFS